MQRKIYLTAIFMALIGLTMVQGILLAQDSGLTTPITGSNASSLAEFFRMGGGDSTLKRTVLSPNGSLMAAATDLNQVAIWDVNSLASAAVQGQQRPSAFLLEGHADTVLDMAFSSDSAVLATAGEDDKLILWDVALVNGQPSGAQRAVIDIAEARNIIFSPVVVQDANGSNVYILAVLNKNADLRMWVINSSGVEPLLTNIPNVNRMTFTPDGKILIVTGNSGVIRFIGATTGESIIATEEPTAIPATAAPTNTPLPPGFPTPTVAEIQVAEQVFENGRMLWVQPVNQIWVLVDEGGNKGPWTIHQDTYEDGEPESDPELTPPDGLFQPERGFGKLWRETPGIRDALGWAVTPEFGYVSEYSYHPGGTMDNGQFTAGPGYHVLYSLEQQQYRFDEATGTWELRG